MRPIRDPVPPEVELGTRAFIVGNGKSLKVDQLNKLHANNEISFGVNRIHLIYGQTAWRPDYWLLTDLDGKKVYLEDIPVHAKQGYPCYVRVDIMARCLISWLGAMPHEEICDMLYNINPLDAVNYIELDTRTTSEPWADGKYNQGGSVAAAQQLALAWGYNPVYMIGCEGDLRANENNHFMDGYADPGLDRRNPAQMEAANDILQLADEIAIKEYRDRDMEIYNATVGGSKRSAIPMVDFWELF